MKSNILSVLGLLSCLLGSLASAGDPPPCRYYSDAGLRAVPPGFQCVTKAGVTFQLVARTGGKQPKEVWLDQKTKLLWGDALDSRNISQYDAAKVCVLAISQLARGNLTNVSWRLPTGDPSKPADDLTQGREDGFAEVLPNLKDRIIWSSSLYKGPGDIYVNSPYYHVYNGYGDFIGDLNRDGYNDGQSVRCVGN